MIIDGHSHACGEYLTSDSLVATIDKWGIDKVILVPGELNSKTSYSLPNFAKLFPKYNVVKITNFLSKIAIRLTGKIKEIPAGNEFVFDLKQKTNGRIIQFIWITTQTEDISNFLDKKYSEWGFHGVKLHQCWEKFSVDSSFFREVALWSEKNDLPLFIHPVSDAEVLKIIDYKRNHPDLKLIIAHLFGLELFIKENFKDDNLYFDSSCPRLISEKRLLDAIRFVGIDKITFGTDTPYGKENIDKYMKKIKNLNLSIQDRDLILGENMRELLKL
jgi:predicted TIM-barrel fold metal-dependent hydrolase